VSLSEYLNLWVACAALFLLPGALAARPIPVLWNRISPGERLLPAFLLSAGYLGVVWVAALLFRPTVEFSLRAWVAGAGLLAVWSIVGPPRRLRPAAVPRRLAPPGPAGSGLWALPILALVWIPIFQLGGGLGQNQDSLELVAFIQRALDTGRIVFAAPIDPTAAGMPPDPRVGAWQLGLTLLARATHLSPVDVWRGLPAFLVPLSLWIFHAMIRRLLESSAVAFTSLAVLAAALLYKAGGFLDNLALPGRVGWVLSWIALWAVALFLDCDRADKTPPPNWSPRRAIPGRGPSRPVGTGALGLAVVAAAILVAIDLLSAFQTIVALAAFCWTWSLSSVEPQPLRRWLRRIPVLATAIVLPLAALRTLYSPWTGNPLHDQVEPLLFLWKQMAIPDPRYVLPWLGGSGLLGAVLAIPMLPRARERRDFAYIAGTTIAAALLLNPLGIWVLAHFHADTFVSRVLLLVPGWIVLGFFLVWAFRAFLREGFRPMSLVALLVLVVVAIPVLRDGSKAVRFARSPQRFRASWLETQPLLRALGYLDARLDHPVLLASDPVTSYQISAFTRNQVLTPYDLHSSPSDARAIERIHDAAAILNPYVSMEETVRLLRKHHAEYVVLNQSFPRRIRTYATYSSPINRPAEREKFLERPDLFQDLYGREQIWIFRFHDPEDGAGSEEAEETPNPFRLLTREEAGTRSASEIARALGARPVRLPPVGGLEIVGVYFDSSRTRPGENLRIISYWRRTGEPMIRPVEAYYRAELPLPDPFGGHSLLGELIRRLRRRPGQPVSWFGGPRQPLEDFFPPYLWEPGAIYWDEDILPIPREARPGLYTVRVLLRERPYAWRPALSQSFSEASRERTVRVGTVEISD
jgi:hypothetical protein